MEQETKRFIYHFRLQDGTELEHEVTISRFLDAPPEIPPDAPEWTGLDYKPCKDCKYAGGERCPVALRLVEPVKKLGGLVSHTPAEVTVIAPERTYRKSTDVQEGLSSLFGLIMATSGCPTMEVFRPMAWFHLPFSALEETLARVLANDILEKFFKGESIGTPESAMEHLSTLYQHIARVNNGIIGRLKTAHAVKADSSFNAIIILGGFGSMVSLLQEEFKKLHTMYQRAG